MIFSHYTLNAFIDILNVLLVNLCMLHLLLFYLVLEFSIHIILHHVEPLSLFEDEFVVEHFDFAFPRRNAAHLGLKYLF